MTDLPAPSGVDPDDPTYVENPVTTERFHFHTRPDDPTMEPREFDIWASPELTPLTAHVHPTQTETFTVNKGSMALRRDGDEESLDEGDETTVPPGTPHSWWVAGDEELHVTIHLDPGLQTEEFLRDLAALARQENVGDDGAPSVLQLAAMFDAYGYEDIYLAKPPLAVQKALFGVLAPVAKLRGYRAKPVPGRRD